MTHKRPLGPTGISVHPIGLGGMQLSLAGRPADADGVQVILAALDAGVELIDTADVYCTSDADIGHNERLIARALREWTGHPVTVATKGGMVRPDGRWVRSGRPEHLRAACEASLRALGVDAITLYQLHVPDDAVPFADSFGALADLRAAGKVVHLGLSNVDVAHIEAARRIAPIVSVQNRCNPLDRSAWQAGVVQHCEREGLAFLPYCPVGGARGKGQVGDDRTLARIAARPQLGHQRRTGLPRPDHHDIVARHAASTFHGWDANGPVFTFHSVIV